MANRSSRVRASFFLAQRTPRNKADWRYLNSLYCPVAEYLRRVIREHRFERELNALINDVIDADQFVEAAEFLLVRDPEIGFQLAPGSSVWFLPMAPIDDKQISLYYTFDQTTVWLLSIAQV
jgi:hypothetical protein